MCGICGRVMTDPSQRMDSALLGEMNFRLAHRGPDETGEFQSEGIGMAASRLSIIDVAGGSQPVKNEDGDVVVVYNGEIYNAPELRASLEAKGHRFRSRTDTEVLVHLYEERGENLVEDLRGMFAFALWDEKRRTLWLARDRAGKKPLYYAATQAGVSFASEIKSLLADDSIDRSLDEEQLLLLMALQYIPSPGTPFRAIRKLPPGCIMAVKSGEIGIRRYWRLPSISSGLGYADALSVGRECVEDAVRARLMSDVPLGALLSGGLDSSAVVAMMARNSRTPVKTFCVSLESPGGRADALHARLAALRFGCDHTEILVSEKEAQGAVGPVFDALDDPILDPACLPTYLICRKARERVTVVLSGEGGDEAFGGYQRYNLAGLGSVPIAWPRRVIESLVRKGLAGRRMAKAVWRMTEKDPVRQHLYTVAAFSPGEYSRLFNSDLGPAERVFRPLFESRRAEDSLNRIMAVDVETWLADDLMQKVDRMSMAVSLEARAPYTDHRVLEFAHSLPAVYKVKGGVRKRIFKDMMKDVVPEEIRSRRKVGFEPPWGEWFKAGLREGLMDSLSSSGLEMWRFVDRAAARNLAEMHQKGGADAGRELFCLYALGEWFRRYAARS